MYNFLRAETINYKNHTVLEDDYTVLRDVLFIEPEYFIITDYMEPRQIQSRRGRKEK